MAPPPGSSHSVLSRDANKWGGEGVVGREGCVWESATETVSSNGRLFVTAKSGEKEI